MNLVIRINSGSTLTELNRVSKYYEDDKISFSIEKLNSGKTLEILASTGDINRGAFTMTIQNQNSGVNCIFVVIFIIFIFSLILFSGWM